MRGLLSAVLLVLVAPGYAEVARITIRPTGVPTGENLVRNPGFEQGDGERAAGWHSGSAEPERVYGVWSDAPIGGGRSAGIRAETAAASGYWVQPDIPLQADEQYLLFARMDHREGRVLIRANCAGGPDARRYAFRKPDLLPVPVFWRPEWVRGHDHTPGDQIFVAFSTGRETDSASISLGLYFSEGLVFFDDVYLGPGELALEYAVEGDGLARVRVLRADGAELARHEGAMVEDGLLVGSLKSLPLLGHYCVEATGADGATTRRWYPREPEGEG